MPDIDPGIKALIEAQLDANKLAQSELNIKRRLESAQLESISSTEALKQDVRQLLREARLATKSMRRQVKLIFQQNAMQDDALRDFFENMSYRVERLEHGLSLLLMERLDSPQVRYQAQNIVDTISKEHRQRLQALHLKNLEYLEEQAAAYGAGSVPLELVNKIIAEKDYIRELS